MYSSIQEHAPALFCSLQIAFAPQGDGMHGVNLSSLGGSTVQISSF